MEIVYGIVFLGIYSFLGWVCEIIYCSVPAKKFINRGFLMGPVCPVYGFGALLIILSLENFTNSTVSLYLLGVIITTVVEYITACLLEYSFNTKWWDYSKYKFNYKGRICLLNSSLFGILVVVLMEGVHPIVWSTLSTTPKNILALSAALISIAFIVDTVCSVISILHLNQKIKALHLNQKISEKIKDLGLADKFNDRLTKDLMKKKQEVIREIKEEIHRVRKELSFSQKRLLKAFPDMKHKKYNSQLKTLREIWTGKYLGKDK